MSTSSRGQWWCLRTEAESIRERVSGLEDGEADSRIGRVQAHGVAVIAADHQVGEQPRVSLLHNLGKSDTLTQTCR